jgi:hypothetical protein
LNELTYRDPQHYSLTFDFLIEIFYEVTILSKDLRNVITGQDMPSQRDVSATSTGLFVQTQHKSNNNHRKDIFLKIRDKQALYSMKLCENWRVEGKHTVPPLSLFLLEKPNPKPRLQGHGRKPG